MSLLKRIYWRIHAHLLTKGLQMIRPGSPDLTAEEWRTIGLDFGQACEDRIVIRCLNRSEPGFFVDAGAFDPVQFSNTLLLYKAGWHGLNIDASEAAIRRFQTLRPRDINVCAALSDTIRELRYDAYPSPATNRLVDPQEISDLHNLLGELPVSSKPVQTRTLSGILAEHLPHQNRFEYLNIDAEGHDFQVLKGLDLNRWTPQAISIESHADDHSIANYLHTYGYQQVSRMLMTNIFLKEL